MKDPVAGEKISIVTDEISQDLDIVEKFLDEFNLNTLEIRMMGGKRIPDIDSPVWEDLKSRKDQNGWQILALSPGTFKGHFTDREKIDYELNSVLPLTIEKAIEIDSKNLITFGFMADTMDEIPDYVIDVLVTAADLCSDAGLNLLLENEPGSFADTGERTRSLLNMVNHPNLQVNWDPCNSGVFNNPSKLAGGALTLGRLIKHVHVKDALPNPGELFPAYCSIETGHLGWKDHIATLRDIGYDGYFGIETHYEPLYEASTTLLTEFRTIMKEINYW